MIFNRLLEKDIPSRTWRNPLHKAALHYREGNLAEAAMILDGENVEGLDPADDARRR